MLKRRIGRKMEAKAEMARALEEILLRHRALIEQALYALEETAPVSAHFLKVRQIFLAVLVSFFFVRRDDRVLDQLDGLLHHFEETILDLQKQEPSFWQLRFVENVRDVLKTRVADHVRANVSAVAVDNQQDPVAVHASATAEALHSAEFRETLQQTYADVQGDIARLTSMLDSDHEEQNDPESTGEHFLDKFWKKLEESVAVKVTRPEGEDGEAGVSVAEFDSCSFEMLTFDDDFNDISRSANR
ncbi:hypothetical protein BBJ28_00011729 [Nothophytophthora sp. Chile5]|nr:hypothetical protein BBJ28_00011729 [Nothophytophthora sp. Chile5]